MVPNWHQHSDTFDRVDARALDNSMDYIWKLCKLWTAVIQAPPLCSSIKPSIMQNQLIDKQNLRALLHSATDEAHGGAFSFRDNSSYSSILRKNNFRPDIFPSISSRDAAWFECATTFILMGVVPFAIVTLIFRESGRDYGLRLGDWKFGLLFIAIVFPSLPPCLCILPRKFPRCGFFYPIDKGAALSLGAFLQLELPRRHITPRMGIPFPRLHDLRTQRSSRELVWRFVFKRSHPLFGILDCRQV